MAVTIPLKDAFTGTTRTVTYRREDGCGTCSGSGAAAGSAPETCSTCGGRGQVQRSQGFFMVQQACPACHGAGQTIITPRLDCRGEGVQVAENEVEIRIPAGIESGQQMRVSGEGNVGCRGGPRGDLLVVVQVEEHTIFQRDGDHLVCEVPITFGQACLGAKIDIPTLSGLNSLKIPAGTQSGRVFRMRGQGMPNLHGYGTGDLHARVVVETPTKLTAKQKELLRDFDAVDDIAHKPQQKSFLDKVKELFD